MAFKAIKYEFVEITVASGATAQRYSFPDLPKLRYTALQAITTYTTNTLTNCPSGNVIAPLAVLKTAYLVVYANERQVLYRIPYLELSATPTFATACSFAFGVYYA